MASQGTVSALTGRIADAPDRLLHAEVLAPQFRYESAHLLPWYVLVEKVLLAEYLRMGLVRPEEAEWIAAALSEVTAERIAPEPESNLSDLAFALERFVLDRLPAPVPAWHVDRSRNDLQACAQLLAGRAQVLRAADAMLACARAAHALAARHTTDLMPGYTHLQPAQVMTAGCYLAAVSAHLLHSLRRLLATYDGIDRSPLGAGALCGPELCGPELEWDRTRMAGLLGFAAAEPHPVVAVASRTWVLEVGAECSTFGVVLSRFVTDLMAWCGGAYRFADLPDALAGISSAMPQKKNFPILERIRGRTAHLTAGYLDAALAQRATPFSNSVEVSKEGAAQLPGMLDALCSALRLLTAVLDRLTFRTERMREVCEREYLGGSALATALTLRAGVPWRTAQVVAGRYILAAEATGRRPGDADPRLLVRLAGETGHAVPDAGELLRDALDPDRGLDRRPRWGSTHPTAVRSILDGQAGELADLEQAWQDRTDTAYAPLVEIDGVVASGVLASGFLARDTAGGTGSRP